MVSIGIPLALALFSPLQPQPQPTAPEQKITSVASSTGGAAAEPSADTRKSPPAQLQGTLRVVLSRLGDDIDVSPPEQALLDDLVVALRAEDPPEAMRLWKEVAASNQRRTGATDIDALVQWVLLQAYLETNEDFRAYARKVKAFNEAKKQIREHLEAVRAQLAAAKKGDRISIQTLEITRKPARGKKMVRLGARKWMTVAQLQAYIAEYEAHLQSLGDDAQLANVDLQNILQKQQQTLQTMSNISKQMHDTAQAIIRKIGG